MGCQVEEEIICNKCLENISSLNIQYCPVCEKSVTENGILCTHCREFGKFPLNQLIVTASYKDKLLAKAVHAYKYKFVGDLSEPLGCLMLEALKKNLRNPIDCIIPIPLHPRRLRWRGFNQSELLAINVSKNLLPGIKIPVVNNAILRKKYTQPQMKVKNYKKRKDNIKNAFVLNNNFSVKNFRRKNILLIDDVCTTGATIFECAKILEALKPKKIISVVLARQS